MLHALCVIALAMLFGGGPVRLCCIFVKFSGFVVIVVCHVGSIDCKRCLAPTFRMMA
jgi:hypothetical protein